MDPQISVGEGGIEDAGEGLSTLVEIRKLLQTDRIAGKKKHALYNMILSELNAIDEGSECLDREAQPSFDKSSGTARHAPATFIPAPKHLHANGSIVTVTDSGSQQHNIERHGMLGKLPMSTLYNEVRSSDLDQIELDPLGAEDDDVENDNDYTANADYWTSAQAVSDSDIECDSIGSGSGDDVPSSSANEHTDQRLESGASGNRENDWPIHGPNGIKADSSDSRDEDSDRTEDRTRMHKYLAPYARAVAKNSGKKVRVRRSTDAETEKKKRLRRARSRSSKYHEENAQSGSDVPSQSSGDDDEMSYDDEHYAQAIADWREVLPLERTYMDQRKDEVRAHRILNENHRTRHDFLESLVDSLDAVDISLTHDDSIKRSAINGRSIDRALTSVDRVDSRGAKILAKASPPKVLEVSSGRRLRTWELPTANSRGRQRSKADTRVHVPIPSPQRKVLVSYPRNGVNFPPMCYDTSSVLAMKGNRLHLQFDNTSHEFSDTFFLAGINCTKKNRIAEMHDGLNMTRNVFQDYSDYMENLEEKAKSAEADASPTGIQSSDIPTDFSAPGRWQQYAAEPDKLWSESSSEILEVFGHISADGNRNVQQFKALELSDDIDVRASLSIEEFMAMYGEKVGICGMHESAVDVFETSDRESGLANDQSVPVSGLISLPLSPVLLPAAVGDFSGDHLSPFNHPSTAMPLFSNKSTLDEDLRKALNSQYLLYAEKSKMKEPTKISEKPHIFNNVRVNARANTSIDLSGGGLPFDALENEPIANGMDDEVSIVSPNPESATPPRYQDYLRKLDPKVILSTTKPGLLEKLPRNFPVPKIHLPIDSLDSDSYNIGNRSKLPGRRDSNGCKNSKPTKIMVVPPKVRPMQQQLTYFFGPCKPLQKRPLARQAQNPGLPLLIRSVFNPGVAHQDQNVSKRGGRYSDTLNALAQSAGLTYDQCKTR